MPAGGRLLVETNDCTSGPLCAKGFLTVPCVRLDVTDTGCGMDAETRSHLLEPFFTTKDPGQGNGLGLAMAHDIVERAGGIIRVESKTGRGTRMSVYFPRVEMPVEKSLSQTTETANKTGSETLLLVEDEGETPPKTPGRFISWWKIQAIQSGRAQAAAGAGLGAPQAANRESLAARED